VLILRRATIDDSGTILTWRNDPDTRSASFSDRVISVEEHEAWLTARLTSTHDESIWIIERDGRNESDLVRLAFPTRIAVGNGRIKIEDRDRAEISIVIDPDLRGQGLGCASIRLLVQAVRRMSRRPVAYIRPENERSIKAFNAAGFYVKTFTVDRMELWA